MTATLCSDEKDIDISDQNSEHCVVWTTESVNHLWSLSLQWSIVVAATKLTVIVLCSRGVLTSQN